MKQHVEFQSLRQLGQSSNTSSMSDDVVVVVDVDNEMEEKVLHVHNILSHVSLENIRLVLQHRTNGSIDAAINFLLSDQIESKLKHLQLTVKKDDKNNNNNSSNNSSGSTGNRSMSYHDSPHQLSELDEVVDVGLCMHRKQQVTRQIRDKLKNNRELEQEYISQLATKEHLRSQVDLMANSPSPLSANHGDDVETASMQKKLSAERKLIEKKMRDEKLQRSTRFFCQGEVEALRKKSLVRYPLLRTNVFDCDAEHIHFRMAESQFQRQGSTTYGGGGSYRVSSVEYIVNPTLVAKFNQCKIDLAQKHGFLVDSMKPLLLFHGTSEVNMENIIKTNFLLEKVGSSTDMGWYGKGFYFSEYPGMSISYSRGNPYLLICLVFVGKAHRMEQVQTGCAKVDGFDSHVSPDGSAEVIIFNPDQVLPCYKVKYEASQGY